MNDDVHELIFREVTQSIGFNRYKMEDDSHDGLIYEDEISLKCGITYQINRPEIPGERLQCYSMVKLQIWITYGTHGPCVEMEITLKASHLSFGYWTFDLVDPNAIRKAQATLRELYYGRPIEDQDTEQDVVPI